MPKSESLNKTIGVACSEREKMVVELVAIQVHKHPGGVSGFLRDRILKDVVKEGEEILARATAQASA